MEYVTELHRTAADRPQLVVGAAVLVWNERGELLLQQSDKSEWALPGGTMEPGETLEQTAVRRLYEEAGLTTSYCSVYRVFSGESFYSMLPQGDRMLPVITVFETRQYSGTIDAHAEAAPNMRFFPVTQLPVPLHAQSAVVLERYIADRGLLY